MNDVRPIEKNNQRRVCDVAFVSGITAADVNEISTLVSLLPNVLIIGVEYSVSSADSTSGAEAQIDLGNGIALIPLDTAGTGQVDVVVYNKDDADIVATAGATAPTDSVFSLTLRYVDLDKTTGEYIQ